MNANDAKKHRSKKGLVDPRSIKEYKVYKETTLMEFLLFKMPGAPRKTIKSLLAHHQVAVGGVMISQFDYALVPEDIVTVSKKAIRRAPTTFSLPILFEDEDIVAIDKPSGLLSVATEREKGKTAYRYVSDYLKAKDAKSRAYVVHRLDEDTSGVLIFAKSNEVKEALQNAWQQIVSKRGYYAIVEGIPNPPEATLKDYLDQDDFQLVYVTKNKTKGKLAITHYKVVTSKYGYCLLDVDISSGRKNQIRVQLGAKGHYVIGDDKYGNPANPMKRLGLHAYELDFINPLNKKQYRICSPMPKEFKALIFGDKPNKEKTMQPKKHSDGKINRLTRAQTKIEVGKRRQKARKAMERRKK